MKTLAFGGTLASKRLTAKLGHISICVTVYFCDLFCTEFPLQTVEHVENGGFIV